MLARMPSRHSHCRYYFVLLFVFLLIFRQIAIYPYYITNTEKYELKLFFLVLFKTLRDPILYFIYIFIHNHKAREHNSKKYNPNQ